LLCRELLQLKQAGIAHGDWQHANILIVREDGKQRLRLVDYDGMFVPPLQGKSCPELGHANYQHPNRKGADFNLTLDHFSSVLIYRLFVDFSGSHGAA